MGYPRKETELLKPFVAEFQALADKAEKAALREIQRLCKVNKWSFKKVYGCDVMKGDINNGKELEDTPIHALVYEFEEYFGNFGCYVCIRGEFQEMEGGLQRSSIPDLS